MSTVDDALAAAETAKAAYIGNPTPATKAAHRAAGLELRYRRWVARGGAQYEPTQATAELHDRWRAENQEG